MKIKLEYISDLVELNEMLNDMSVKSQNLGGQRAHRIVKQYADALDDSYGQIDKKENDDLCGTISIKRQTAKTVCRDILSILHKEFVP